MVVMIIIIGTYTDNYTGNYGLVLVTQNNSKIYGNIF